MPKNTNDSTEKKVTKRIKKEDKVVEEPKKESIKKEIKIVEGTQKKTTKTANTKKTTSKSSTKKTTSTKTSVNKENLKETAKSSKTATKAKTSRTTKKVSSKTDAKTTKTTKKVSSKTTTKKSTKASSTSKTRTRKTAKKEEVLTNLEYYDLPYRYNQTIVKILAQTPNTLFIYWDISDDDRKNLEETFGNDFFYNTKPVLIVHNETKNYSFEVEINDFANSWYLHITDTDCKYNIELGRRFFKVDNTNNENVINTYKNNNYIYISSSNKLVTPNDHILLNFNNNSVQFKNVKNNTYFSKEIKNVKLYDLYKEIYSEEILNTLPSNPSSDFKM